ncbi:MAG: MFS transporter [Dehalococcoidales bacterium]|nr:MFS transporter [Dehalococcoidales bacterium]
MKPSEDNKTGGASSRFRALRSLKNPTYRFYISGSLCQFACLSMQIITGPLLMYRITGSPALLGTMALVSAFPMIFVSLFGGAIADRIPKKRVVIMGLLGSSVLAIVVALLLSTGYISRENPDSWMILIVTALIMGSLMGLMMPALQAIVAEIVAREELMNAVALNTMGMNTLNLMAPGLAGFMIDAFDFHAVYFTMAGLYLCGAFFISFLPATGQAITGGGNILEEIRRGFQYIRKDRMILFVLGFSLMVTVLAMPYQQLLPIYVDDILKVGATGMGVLMSVSGAGALVGSITLASLPNKKRGLMLMASGLVAGMALVVFSFSATWALSLSVIIFIGLSHTFRMTIGSTLLQARAEPEYRGRVMSIFSMQWGFMSVCTFVAGILAEYIPVQWILGSLAMLLIALSALAIVFIPSIRKLD